MFGADWEQNNPAPQVYFQSSNTTSSAIPGYLEDALTDETKHGLIPKSISAIFDLASTKPVSVFCSFLQIYNERLYDLLQDPKRLKSLEIRENKTFGIFVENLAEYVVENVEDCFRILMLGDRNRAVRQTKFNHHSSRSHTIFQISVESDRANKKGFLKKSKLNFCDLAGSEKYDKEHAMVQDHVKELTLINKSLSALGKVIHSLSSKTIHVPYRDSKLTRLLQDSLGMNTRTILIATVSPAANYVDETISTLKFADRARQVVVTVKKNEISAVSDELVMKLQREIQHLRSLLNIRYRGRGVEELQQQLWQLKEENQKLKRFTRNMSVEEVEVLKQENKRLRLELQQMTGTANTVQEFFKETSSEAHSEEPRACPYCRIPPPCVHIAGKQGSFVRSGSTSSSLQSENTRMFDINKLNVRYKVKNSTLDIGGVISEIQEEDKNKKEIKNIRARLAKITQLEAYRKEQFRKELEKLEENKRIEEEQQKRRASNERKRQHKINGQKKMLSEYKHIKKLQLEAKARVEEEQRKTKEQRQKKYYENQKKKLLEAKSNEQ